MQTVECIGVPFDPWGANSAARWRARRSGSQPPEQGGVLDTQLAIGVDIGATNTRAAVVTRSGQIVARAQRLTRFSGMRLPPDDLVQLVVACVREVETAAGVQGLPVGVGSIGQIHRETGRILGTTADYAEYIGFPLRDRLAAALAADVWLDNDAKVAGLGEFRCGAGRPYRHLVYFGLGTGIGGAVFVDGRLVHGATGLAGHLGVVSVDWRGPVFPSRTPGPVEGYASGTGIARLGRAHGLGDEDRRLTSEEVFAAAAAGDPQAQAAISDAARALGVAITSVLYVLNPEAVVIGGGVAQVGEPFLAQVRAAVADCAMPEFARTPLLPAALGAESGLVGAGVQVWEG